MTKQDIRGLGIRLDVLEAAKPVDEADQQNLDQNIRHVKRVLTKHEAQPQEQSNAD